MTEQPKSRRILRDPEVTKRTGRSRVQRWRDAREGKFPSPVRLGANAVGWYEDEIEAWLAARPRVTYPPAPATAAPAAVG